MKECEKMSNDRKLTQESNLSNDEQLLKNENSNDIDTKQKKRIRLNRKQQIDRDKQEIERLKKRLQINQAKQREIERKARTKRLIELGAIIESKLSDEAISVLKIIPKDDTNLKSFINFIIEHKDDYISM